MRKFYYLLEAGMSISRGRTLAGNASGRNRLGVDRHVFEPFGTPPPESQMTLTMLTILHAVDLEMRPAGYELRIRRTPTSRPCNRFSLRATARSH